MNTKQMDYILELSQIKNFNHAAENLYISQPTMTYQIKLVEEEVGFQIFERSGKGASLTPAGEQFCVALKNIREELKRAIEQGQNFSSLYRDNLNIGLPMRSAVYFLPQAITEFSGRNPSISITPIFRPFGYYDAFLKGEQDIVFALEEDMRRVPDVKIYPLFTSGIYLITEKSDPLAKKERITADDLTGRTLMVGGGSPPALRAVQQRLIQTVKLRYFNSYDHDTTLTNVAAHRGVCLAPGFLNDHSGQFAWTPFECKEHFNCVLCTRSNEQRTSVQEFVRILQNIYKKQENEWNL